MAAARTDFDSLMELQIMAEPRRGIQGHCIGIGERNERLNRQYVV